MKNVTQRIVAADLMQRDIVAVSPDDTLRDALALMTDNHVTGLPVMNGQSRCVGLITASDILNYEDEHANGSAETGSAQFFDPETQQWDSVLFSAFGLEEFGDVRVQERHDEGPDLGHTRHAAQGRSSANDRRAHPPRPRDGQRRSTVRHSFGLRFCSRGRGTLIVNV